MAISDSSLYRTRDEIVAQMIAQLVTAIPDAYVGEDGVATIFFRVEAGQLENLYLANQLLLEDMFVQSANYDALLRHGQQFGLAPNPGMYASGNLTFEGSGGTYIPIDTEVGYDPGGGLDVVYFNTMTDGTIPNPGTPAAPVAAVDAAAGTLNGAYEYAVTFVTASGETLLSAISNAVNPASKKVALSGIPLGGVGTTKRRLYRAKNGTGVYRMVIEIVDNTTTTYLDNIADATVASNSLAPTVDTAHKVTLAARAESVGIAANVAAGAVTELTAAPTTLTGVTNDAPFTGGAEEEDIENFRTRLLSFIQNPLTGSATDLKMWAEGVDGVDTATVFPNTPAAGEVTVRIAGPGGAIPDAGVIAACLAALQAQDLCNITIHVATFTASVSNVVVTVVLDTGYTLDDVTPSVETAIQNYINNLETGGTLYVAGIVDAIYGLPGILDVVVTTPAANQTTTTDHKRTVGTITVGT